MGERSGMDSEKRKRMVTRILRMAAEERVTIDELRRVLADTNEALNALVSGSRVPDRFSNAESVARALPYLHD